MRLEIGARADGAVFVELPRSIRVSPRHRRADERQQHYDRNCAEEPKDHHGGANMAPRDRYSKPVEPIWLRVTPISRRLRQKGEFAS